MVPPIVPEPAVPRVSALRHAAIGVCVQVCSTSRRRPAAPLAVLVHPARRGGRPRRPRRRRIVRRPRRLRVASHCRAPLCVVRVVSSHTSPIIGPRSRHRRLPVGRGVRTEEAGSRLRDRALRARAPHAAGNGAASSCARASCACDRPPTLPARKPALRLRLLVCGATTHPPLWHFCPPSTTRPSEQGLSPASFRWRDRGHRLGDGVRPP